MSDSANTMRTSTVLAFLTALCSLFAVGCAGTVDKGGGEPQPPASPSPPGVATAGTGVAGVPTNTIAPPAGSPAVGSPVATPTSTGAAVRGILDCPTVPYPGTSITDTTRMTMSEPFTKVCSTCHGGAGEGKGAYPPLPGMLSQADFVARVRAGTANMPAFSRELIDDAALARDYQALKARTQQGIDGTHPSQRWSAAEIAAKRTAGLAIWRKPDSEGAACANCHSPDAIDLAVIGYADAEIMRRGLVHLAASDALAIIDFVHAQRRFFNIERPCSPDWRVFQPGGEVLPGNTFKEQDEALWAELVRRDLFVATGKVMTVEDADKAWNELATLNMRKMRIGIPLARWTEDRFNGDEHNTINDWITAVPRMPVGPAWYALVDQYLADPTTDRMVGLLSSVDKLTQDGGFSKINGGNGDMSAVMTSKYHGVQLGSHYFRLALLGKPGWFETAENPPAVPSTRGEGTSNSFSGIGFAFQENHCYNQTACPPAQFNSLPAFAKVEFDAVQASMPSGSGGLGFNAMMQKALTHPWWTLATIFDPSFNGGRGLVMHYWLENALPGGGVNFPQRTYHRPFMMGVTMVKRAIALEKSNAALGVPGVLFGNTMMGFENTIGSGVGTTPENTRLTSNLMRMTLLRMKRDLAAGAPVANPLLFTSANGMGDWAGGLDRASKTGKFDTDYLNSTSALAREVLGLIGKAPVALMTNP